MYYKNERNIQSWTHEALVLNECNKHGWTTIRPPVAVTTTGDKSLFKEQADAVIKRDGLEYITMIKSWDFLNNIPDNHEDPVSWLNHADYSQYSITNQKSLGTEGDRWIPIDVVWETKFRDPNLSDWSDDFVYDWYNKRVFIVADDAARYSFIIHGRKVRNYPPRTWWTGPSPNSWNFIPLSEVSKVWTSTDDTWIRDTPWST